jgi:pilus assembly protein FimV
MAINKNKVMDAARKARDKGQLDKAIKEYLKIVREDPKDVRVWLKIGDLYAKKGAKAEATDTYLRVAKFYSEQGFYLKAVAVYKQILKLDPRLVEVNLKLAELYRQLGLLSDAMQHFEMVAAFFHREGKTREALATIRQLVDLDPENVATRIKLAELYSKEGMVEDAVTEFGHACEYLRKHNRLDDFLKVAERLLWHKPDHVALNRELAGLYLRRNDPRRALQKLQTCFKSDPRDVETLGLLAQAFQALDQKGKTVSVLKEMARVLVEVGKRREAEDVHRKILAFVPSDPDSRAFLGDAASQARSGSPVKAVADAVLEPPPRRTAAVRGMVNPTGSIPLVMQAKGRGMGASFSFEAEASDDEVELELGDDGAQAQAPAHAQAQAAPIGDGIAGAGVEEDGDFISELSLEDNGFEVESSAHGEAHSEEIVKILTETDVYVKYGLHQKAVDHLGRVFHLDPQNREAHERLKDILVIQGRIDDAIAQLCRLAEQCGVPDPGRAENYLREVMRLDPNNGRALELAERYRVDLSGSEDMEVVDDRARSIGDGSGLKPGTGQVPAVPPSVGPRAAGSVASAAGPQPRMTGEELDFDDLDLDSDEEVAVAAAAAAAMGDERAYAVERLDAGAVPEMLPALPGGVTSGRFESDGFEFELGDDDEEGADAGQRDLVPAYEPVEEDALVAAINDAGSGATVEVAMDQVEEAVSITDLDPDELDFDAAPVGSDPLSPIPRLGGQLGLGPGPGDPIDEDDVGEDLPFDPNDARMFDAEPGFDEDGAPAFGEGPLDAILAGVEADAEAEDAAAQEVHSLGRFVSPAHGVRQGYDYGPAASLTPPDASPSVEAGYGAASMSGSASRTLENPLEEDGPPTRQERREDPEERGAVGTSLEDDLDEADFFVGQGLWEEAREILRGLLQRYHHHPLVMAKLRDVEAMAGGAEPDDGPQPRFAAAPAGHDDAVPDDLGGEPAVAGEMAVSSMRPARPVVLLEKPIEDSDADTHFDLGLAYKEMGLHDEAIKAFHKVLSASRREVQSHMMIGLCQREQGNLSEAINQFKAGLYVDKITSAEKFGLYYEIGSCYEDLEDPQEALYYYEMVLKKEHSYRDVTERVAGLRAALGGAASAGGKRQSTLDAETDAALDHLKR